jgi:hypothetical protein
VKALFLFHSANAAANPADEAGQDNLDEDVDGEEEDEEVSLLLKLYLHEQCFSCPSVSRDPKSQ